jgi:hypothetical protein
MWSEFSGLQTRLSRLEAAVPEPITSLIAPNLPSLFSEFRGKQFRLSDGQAERMTAIADSGGFIFGGFTPLAWDGNGSIVYRADPSQWSLLFTANQSWGVGARILQCAIFCSPAAGPTFGYDHNISIGSDSNADASSYTDLSSYADSTGRDPNKIFTGACRFRAGDRNFPNQRLSRGQSLPTKSKAIHATAVAVASAAAATAPAAAALFPTNPADAALAL